MPLHCSNHKDTEKVISFSSEELIDPRLDNRIVVRWKADGKIK